MQVQRKIDALNSRMMELVSGSVKSGGEFEDFEDEFKDLSDQIKQYKSHIAAIQSDSEKDTELRKKIAQIDEIIEKRQLSPGTYDDSIVRQMIECVKVFPDGRLTVYFGGDYKVEEYL